MACVIEIDGTIRQVFPGSDGRLTTEELCKAVGGVPEILPYLHRGYRYGINIGRADVMVVNDNGLFRNLPPNETASAIYRFSDVIVGPAVICKRGELPNPVVE